MSGLPEEGEQVRNVFQDALLARAGDSASRVETAFNDVGGPSTSDSVVDSDVKVTAAGGKRSLSADARALAGAAVQHIPPRADATKSTTAMSRSVVSVTTTSTAHNIARGHPVDVLSSTMSHPSDQRLVQVAGADAASDPVEAHPSGSASMNTHIHQPAPSSSGLSGYSDSAGARTLVGERASGVYSFSRNRDGMLSQSRKPRLNSCCPGTSLSFPCAAAAVKVCDCTAHHLLQACCRENHRKPLTP